MLGADAEERPMVRRIQGPTTTTKQRIAEAPQVQPPAPRVVDERAAKKAVGGDAAQAPVAHHGHPVIDVAQARVFAKGRDVKSDAATVAKLLPQMLCDLGGVKDVR